MLKEVQSRCISARDGSQATVQQELPQFSHARELAASQLKRGIHVFRHDLRARLEPDGSSSWVQSAGVNKLIFGRETAEAFKIQSGVRIAIRPQDFLVRSSPVAVAFTARGQERVVVSHTFRLVLGDSEGATRAVRLTNRGDAAAKIRVITLHDPTSLNFRRGGDPPGEIGVNAFNRNDQVFMDDVGDTTGVRVIGFFPRPSVIYMTKDKGRAAELLALGELPESSLGMSGSVIIMTQHDLDLPPGATADVRCISVYHPTSLESALNAASTILVDGEPGGSDPRGPEFSSSSASFNFAFDWAKAALFATEGEGNLAELLWAGVALSILRSDAFVELAEAATRAMRKDGTLRYSEDGVGGVLADRPGPVETSLYVMALSAFLSGRARDKKLVKRWYPRVRKAADGLSRLALSGLLHSSPYTPDGWRRRLGAGFPSGNTSEVNLLGIRALNDASTAAYIAGRGSDSAKFREVSLRIQTSLNEKLRDSETGALALNADSRGVVHREITIDQAVGLSCYSPDPKLASSVVHRLLEKDFETGYGPRTVPASNNLYYSQTYADGQLGGYWTRAALSHALLAYHAGYPGIGSLQLEKVARLVHLDAERMGGMAGEFPYWIDTERGQAMGAGSDPVAAARFIEALIFGEAGLSVGPQGPRLRIPEASQLRWVLVHDLNLGKRATFFVGRHPGRTFVASTLDRESVDDSRATRGASSPASFFPECERLDQQVGLEGVVFWDNACSLLCVGSHGSSGFSGTVSVPLRSRSFSASLFAGVEELQQETGLWHKVDQVKALNRFEARVDLKQNGWKMVRLTPTPR